jgi:hypothetical protein
MHVHGQDWRLALAAAEPALSSTATKGRRRQRASPAFLPLHPCRDNPTNGLDEFLHEISVSRDAGAKFHLAIFAAI